MIAGIKRVVCRTASATGLFGLSRVFTAHLPRILMYHGFCGADEGFDDCTDVDMFRRQLMHIKRHYRPMKLSALWRRLASGEPLPDRTVVLTVDDGYANFARWAAPLLREFEVPATLFVVSDFPDTGQWLWTDKLKFVLERCEEKPECGAEMKRMPVGERAARLAELAERSAVSIPDRPPQRYSMLGFAELRELAAGGLIEIGAHTRDHPILGHVSSEDARGQIGGSRRELERKLGAPVTTFCYPNGKPGDYTREQIEMVREAGFVCATASHIGWVSADSNRFALPRIGGDGDMLRFRKYLDGFEYWQRRAAGVRSV